MEDFGKKLKKIGQPTGSMDTFGTQSNGHKGSRSSGNFPTTTAPDGTVSGETRLEEVRIQTSTGSIFCVRLALKRSRVIWV